MAHEKVVDSSEDAHVPPAATAILTPESPAADTHKRKLDDFELSNMAEPVIESENSANPDTLNNGTKEKEEDGGADESEPKRPRLECNGDNVTEAEAGPVDVSLNGHEEEGKDESEEDKPEQLESTDVQPVENQEPPKEPIEQELPEAPVETVTEEQTSNENEKTELGNYDKLGQPNAENEEPSELPREGDVPVHSAERRSGSDRQILSRKMEVPNDKVGVLIGKAGDTIRSLQDNSGAKIQIMRDADSDPRSTSRPVELVGTLGDINKAEKLIKDVIAEADAGGSPSLVARGFNAVQAASGGELVEIQVPFEKVGLIIGKGGETIRSLQTRSGARIQLIQQSHSDGEQAKDRTVRISGNKRQIDTAREMIKDVMNQTVRPSPLSGGYSQQGYRPPHGPLAPHWGPRGSHHTPYSGYDYPQRGTFPSQGSQYPPLSYSNYPPSQPPRSNFGPSWEQRPPSSMHGPSPQGNYNYGQQPGPDFGHPPSFSQPPPYGHGYNDNHAPPQHYGPQPSPYSQGGMQSGFGPPQDQYGKPPMYAMQQPSQVPQPHSQPYGQPRPGQPGEVPYQGPASSSAQPYGQNMPPQQPYPYPLSGPTQQTYPPPYGAVSTSDGYGQPSTTVPSGSGYGQPIAYGQSGAPQQQQQQVPPAVYPQAGTTGGFGSYAAPQPGGYAEQPAAASNNAVAGYGYHQGQPDQVGYGAPQVPTTGYPATGVSQAGGYVQPAQAQPGYDQPGGYGNVPAQAPTGVSQAGYAPQYDATQMYGGHR